MVLLTQIIFNPSMDWWLRQLWSVGETTYPLPSIAVVQDSDLISEAGGEAGIKGTAMHYRQKYGIFFIPAIF